MAIEWKREANVIAERFEKDEIPGFLAKEFIAKHDEFVVLEKEREIYSECGPGRFAISSFAGDLTDILLLDKSEKMLEREIKNVWVADGKGIDIKLVMKFRIFHSDHFSKNLMGERKRLFIEDVWDETLSKVIYKANLPRLQKKPSGKFLCKDFREKARKDMEGDIKKAFKEWGLILSSLSVDFKIPEETGREEGESGEGMETEGAKEMEGEVEEKELPEPEAEKEAERKGTEEAAKLKGAGEREKLIRETERREIWESRKEEKLIEKLEELNRAKEITEKKFYKKELSEEAFERMMEDFEKKIIEIETKLKRRKR